MRQLSLTDQEYALLRQMIANGSAPNSVAEIVTNLKRKFDLTPPDLEQDEPAGLHAVEPPEDARS